MKKDPRVSFLSLVVGLTSISCGLFLSEKANAGVATVEIKSIYARNESRIVGVCTTSANGSCPVSADSPYCSAAGASSQLYLNMDNNLMSKEQYATLLTAHAASKNVQLFISNANPCFIETINILK